MTRYAEVIGDPIAQSKSPLIHKHWLQKLGLDADYRASHVTGGELADYCAFRCNDPDWLGCNVTMPHKQTIMRELSGVDQLAASVGAVNTVIPQDEGTVLGTNTDSAGFLEPLRPDLSRRHLFRMARVLGTGGAARARGTAAAVQRPRLRTARGRRRGQRHCGR